MNSKKKAPPPFSTKNIPMDPVFPRCILLLYIPMPKIMFCRRLLCLKYQYLCKKSIPNFQGVDPPRPINTHNHPYPTTNDHQNVGIHVILCVNPMVKLFFRYHVKKVGKIEISFFAPKFSPIFDPSIQLQPSQNQEKIIPEGRKKFVS